MSDFTILVFRVDSGPVNAPSPSELLKAIDEVPPVNRPGSQEKIERGVEGTGVYKFNGVDGETYYRVSPADFVKPAEVITAVRTLCAQRGLAVSIVDSIPGLNSSEIERKFE